MDPETSSAAPEGTASPDLDPMKGTGANSTPPPRQSEPPNDGGACLVCAGYLDRDGDLCHGCVVAFILGIRRRRDAALRLAPLADGRRDPWGGAA